MVVMQNPLLMIEVAPINDSEHTSLPSREAPVYANKSAQPPKKKRQSRNPILALARKYEHSPLPRSIATAHCRVASGSDDKRRVAVELFDAAGKWVNMGRVVIPANYQVPAIGQAIEVRYCRTTKGGVLARPVFQGVRGGATKAKCALTQLRSKSACVRSREDLATADREACWVLAAAQGNPTALQWLEKRVESSLSMAASMLCKRIRNESLFHDAKQVGFMAVLSYIQRDKFDPRYRVQITTAAQPNIVVAMKRKIEDMAKQIHIPVNKQEKRATVHKHEDIATADDEYRELVKKGVNPHTARIVAESFQAVSFDATTESGGPVHEAIAEEGANFHQELRRRDRLQEVREILGELERREPQLTEVLTRVHLEGQTCAEAASEMKINQDQVRQLLRKSMDRMRDMMGVPRGTARPAVPGAAGIPAAGPEPQLQQQDTDDARCQLHRSLSAAV